MTSNNKTVSRQKSLSGQHCKIFDDRRPSKSSMCYITNDWPVGKPVNFFSFYFLFSLVYCEWQNLRRGYILVVFTVTQ